MLHCFNDIGLNVLSYLCQSAQLLKHYVNQKVKKNGSHRPREPQCDKGHNQINIHYGIWPLSEGKQATKHEVLEKMTGDRKAIHRKAHVILSSS